MTFILCEGNSLVDTILWSQELLVKRIDSFVVAATEGRIEPEVGASKFAAILSSEIVPT